jgi:RNA polymerase sigma factor (sigma-70 family)
MTRDSAVPPKSLDEILAWLDPERDVAVSMYLQLRNDLAKLFALNHCSDPEWLADETLDRAAKKVQDVRETYEGNPKLYFYGIARNLIKEESKRVKRFTSLDGIDPPAQIISETDEETAEMREECLDSCLKKLSAEKRKLIRDYYAKEKQAKIDHRAELSQQLGINIETLRVRVHRIRNSLHQCIERCLERKAKRK